MALLRGYVGTVWELESPRVLPHSDLNAERLETYFQ